MIALALEGVRVEVAGRRLVAGLDLRVRPGELWTVVGPNGAGKTSLLRVAAGLRAPAAGRVSLEGQPIAEMSARARARALAYLPQTTPLYHDLGVREIVALGRAPHLGVLRGPSAEDLRAVDGALVQLGLQHLASRRITTLSGGERQRVMLARMLATGARVLVLDEPTTALDIGHALDLLERLRTLCGEGIAVVVAMHELELARRYGDRSLCLDAGHDHDIGVTSEVLAPSLLERRFKVRVTLGEGLRFDPPVPDDADAPPRRRGASTADT